MPNIDEFFKKESDVKIPVNAQKIEGQKPCSKCDKDTTEAWWDPDQMLLFWTCPDGHRNEHRVG
jgi:hypothetical protein